MIMKKNVQVNKSSECITFVVMELSFKINKN